MKSIIFNDKIHLLLATIMYLLSPRDFSIYYCIILFLLFVIIAFRSIAFEFEIKRYFSFNMIFMLSVFICTFIIPLFLAPLGFYVFYGYLDYINSSTALVVLACSIYNLGWQYAFNKTKNQININSVKVIYETTIPSRVVKVLNFLSIVSVIYYLLVFRQTVNSNLDNADLAETSFTTILQSILTLSLIVNVKSAYINKSDKNIVNFFLRHRTIVFCFIVCIILPMLVGDRTMPIYLMTVLAATYILLYQRIRFLYIGAAIILAAIIMFTIGRTRYADNSFKNVGISGALNTISETVNQPFEVEEVFIDFLPASMSLYLFENWRETNNDNLYYPGKIFILPFSPIPYAPSALTKLFYGKDSWNDVLSATLSADCYRKMVRNLEGGIGTHVVGDIYISWGLIGVVLIFFFFGYLISRGQTLCSRSIIWSIVYITYCGQAMYIARGTLYICYRPIITQIILFFIICLIMNYKVTKQEK